MACLFYYVAVKGSLTSGDCDVFGLDPEEISALTKRFPNSNAQISNGVVIKGINHTPYLVLMLSVDEYIQNFAGRFYV